MNTQVMQVQTMIEKDQFTAKQKGYKKTQYRQSTIDAVINLTKNHKGSLGTLAKSLNINLGQIYTWRYKAGVVANKKISEGAKKGSKKRLAARTNSLSPNQNTIDRLNAQAERINKQLELIRLADELGMQLDFE